MIASRVKKNLWKLRNHLNAISYGGLAISSRVSSRAKVDGAKGVYIGENVCVWEHAIIRCSPWGDPSILSGEIRVGNSTVICSHACLWTCGGKISIGENCSLNPYAILYGHGGLTIGNNVRIATHAIVIPSNHNFEARDLPIVKQGGISNGITIRDDVWIGAGAIILDGVTIAEGSVVGAGSVVTKSTEPYGVYVGTPARKIRSRN